MSFSRNGVRIRKSLSNDDFVKCLKRNLNATFTMYSFRKSRRQMKILIYRIWIIMLHLKSEIYLHYPTSFSCNLFNFYMNCVLFCSSFFFFLKGFTAGQYSVIIIIIIIIIIILLPFSLLLWFHYITWFLLHT